MCVALIAGLLGLGFVTWHINRFNNHNIPDHLEGEKIVIIGKVKDVIIKKSAMNLIVKTLNFDVNNKYYTIQPTIKISLAFNNKILPGQIWSFTVKLKKPRNYANPGSFDVEKFMFAAKIHALGYVVDNQLKFIANEPTWLDSVQNLRLKIANFIDKQNYQYGAIIKALSIGLNDLPFKQKTIFQNTGLAHILAISGLHLGFIAMLIYKLTKHLIYNYNLRIYITWAVACMYSALAGFSIPTQRALIMLSMVFVAKLLKRHVSSVNTLVLALLAILLYDPLCILSIGFWLSFVAVATILLLSSNAKKLSSFKFNLLMTLAMLPLTLLFFSKSSLIAPISNFIFVPVIGIMVIPACFLAIICYFIKPAIASWIFGLVNKVFSLLWPVLIKLSSFPIYELTITQEQYISLVIASIGILYIIYPRKLPLKPVAILCCAPLYLYYPKPIEPGEFKFTQLDVGQGASSVIQTTNHAIIYDTGPKKYGFDAGSQVLVPFLKHERIKQIDLLIISHADNDHIGGTEALMLNMPVKKLLASETAKLEAYPLELCNRGQVFVFDGVRFEILHPEQAALNLKRNDKSCVLKVVSKSNKVVLIAGDIEKKSEKQLLAKYTTLELATHILVAPHHGSKTSSSREFIASLRPQIAIFPTGYKNNYGHPKPEVLNKYLSLQTKVLDTSYTGAISFTTQNLSKISCYRTHHRNFWSR